MQEIGVTTDIAKTLGVGASTLRKYAAALEEKGYVFERAVNQSRIYTEADVECFRYLKSLLRENNMTMAEAVEMILTELRQQAEPAPFPQEPSPELLALVEEVTTIAPTWQNFVSCEEQDQVQGQGSIILEQKDEDLAVELSADQQQPALLVRWEELQCRIAELEERQEKLLQTHSELYMKLEEQRRWIKEKTEEERDRQLITNLRSYQGRRKKERSTLFSFFGFLPRKSKEA